MASKVKVLKVKTTHGHTRRRAGHSFGPEERTLLLADLKNDHVAALKADPFLSVSEDSVDASEVKSDAPKQDSPNYKAILKGDLKSIAELFPKLSDDDLVELSELENKGAKRADVIDALEAELDKR